MKRIVAFGEIMGRLSPPGFRRFQQAMPGQLDFTFAGAEADVAVSLALLGAEASFVTALPDHAIAEACLANLRGMGVDTRHILRTPHGRMGLFFLESGANQRPGNVLYDRDQASVAITPPEAYDWAAILEGANWFHISGITPAISRIAADVARAAMRAASERGLTVSCDMNFRSKLWRWDPERSPRDLAAQTMRTLLPYVTMFIGGREDAAMTLDLHARDGVDDPNLDVARQITAQFPRMKHVAMTLREGISANHNNWGGMLYEVATDQAFYAPIQAGVYHPYAITHIVDRLGAGDAFSAGLIYSLTTPELARPQVAVSFAVAAGCLAHSIEGDFNLSTRGEIEALMGGAASGRVNR